MSSRATFHDGAQDVAALISGERDAIANMANTASLLYNRAHESSGSVNWLGFYVLRDGELVLGPFMGRPACIRIALSRGVCGAAAAEGVTKLVPDVHAFPGHIACDAASRSELVVPMRDAAGKTLGVLDIDANVEHFFTDADAAEIEAVVRALVPACDWGEIGAVLE